MSRNITEKSDHHDTVAIQGTQPESKVLVQRHPWTRATLLIFASLLAVYSFSLHSWTFLRQEESVLRIPVLSNYRNIPAIFGSEFTLYSSGQYRPVAYALLAAVRTVVPTDYLVFWHLWLVVFHAVNALLVFALIRRFSERWITAMSAALIFALHPLAAILLNDLNQFYMVLGFTFSLASLNAYLAFRHNGKRIYYALALLAFLLGLGTARPVFVLGLILLACDWLLKQRNLKSCLPAVSPFLLIPLLLIPILTNISPHPLHYKYVEMPAGSFWNGLYSFTGGMGTYLSGILLTRNLPTILYETVERIYSLWSLKFLFWATCAGLIIAASLGAFIKKRWSSLGILFALFTLIPYASVAYNQVVEYISWSYFYFPLAGVAFFLAGVLEWGLLRQRRLFRTGFGLACLSILIFLAGRTAQYNRYAQEPISYWMHALDFNDTSPTAYYEISRNYLAEEQPVRALHFFFAPMIRDIKKPCLAMARYYSQKGDSLAASIHLRFGSAQDKAGRFMEPPCIVGAEVLLRAGIVDYSEELLGKMIMVNPFRTEAMALLARVWAIKGLEREALRMLDRIRAIDPHDQLPDQLENQFKQLQQEDSSNPNSRIIQPPSPDSLEYVLNQNRRPGIRNEIIALSDRYPKDPIIQMEAAICCLENGNNQLAAKKIKPALPQISGFSYGCAVACRALALSGEAQQAGQLGLRAIALDNQSTLAWESLALAHAQKGAAAGQSPEFLETVAQYPTLASYYYYNLGLQKKWSGQTQEATDLLQKAVDAAPAHYDARLELGRILVEIRQPDRAIPVLEKALTMKTDDPEIYHYLGRAYIMKKQNEEGIHALQTAIQINPKNEVYHYVLGLALDSLNQPKEAAQEYARAVELNPSYAHAHFKWANYLFRIKKYDEAYQQYSKVAELDPKYEYVHLNLCSLLHSLNRLDDSIREANEELQCNPKIPETYDILITLYCEKGDYEKAKATADHAASAGITLKPTSLNLLKKNAENEQ